MPRTENYQYDIPYLVMERVRTKRTICLKWVNAINSSSSLYLLSYSVLARSQAQHRRPIETEIVIDQKGYLLNHPRHYLYTQTFRSEHSRQTDHVRSKRQSRRPRKRRLRPQGISRVQGPRTDLQRRRTQKISRHQRRL